MPFVCRLIEGTLPAIDLFYSATDAWAMLEKGLEPNDPERRELWGGYLENVLVRQEDGKRTIPLKLQGIFDTPDALIDAVNALEERLRHAARYRKDGWGDEVFLQLQLHNATHAVRYPVSSGAIGKNELMNACSSTMESGHRVTKAIEIGVTIVCGEPYWEADTTYTLENYVDNPGFWRGTTAPGDSWTEVDPAGNLTLAWRTGTRYVDWQVMGRSLEWTISPDGANDLGITSDAQTVLPSTWYYWEIRGYHTVGCDDITASVWDVTGAPAEIVAARLIFDNQDDAWEKLGAAFQTGVACTSIEVRARRMIADSTAGDKSFRCDAFYLEPRTDAPVGWSSGRNLVNHLDGDADHLNVLCVTEIPGETEAEIKDSVFCNAQTMYMRIAKRTRNDPHGFLWHLLPCSAYTTAEGGVGGACTPGLTSVSCKDSDKIVDATSPSGSRITVTFATDKTMALRCFWSITSAWANLASYQGRFVLWVIAKRSNTTDKINMSIRELDTPHFLGLIEKRPITATVWTLHDGWEILEYRLGETEGLFGLANYERIYLYADNDAAGAPATQLHIAGAYLVPIDESLVVAGDDNVYLFINQPMIFNDMDNKRGVWCNTATAYYPSINWRGTFPVLTPEVENWLYFIGLCGSATGYVLSDTYRVSVEYRPRGIFLRGTNP